MRLTRRNFFTGASAVAGAVSGFWGARLIGVLGAEPEGPWKALDVAEVKTLEAVAERIIPSDDAPGAKEAKVVRYIDRQLAKDAPYERFLTVYRNGLQALDRTARVAHGKNFADCEAPVQDAMLSDLEQGRGSNMFWKHPADREFFNLVLSHVKQGFYGNPCHGGNDHYVSYRMLGVAGPGCTGRTIPEGAAK